MINNIRMQVRLIVFIFLISAAFASASGARAATYDFYVDDDATAEAANGSEQFPFKTITAAINQIKNQGLREKSVYIKKGVYAESVELVNGTDLVGEERYETEINADGKNYGIYFRASSSQVRNLTVKNADVNLKVGKKSKVTIENCSVKDSRLNGIEVDKSSNSKKYGFTFKNSSVKDSGKRGVYIFKRKVEISGSDFEGNEEEGIDLHTNLRGTISGNSIKNNKESGIEIIMAGTKITIKGNHISGNKTQGLTIQVYDKRKGKIKITSNHIEDNSDYGIRYARYDGGKLKMKFHDFIKSCVKRSKNIISGNGDGDYNYELN